MDQQAVIPEPHMATTGLDRSTPFTLNSATRNHISDSIMNQLVVVYMYI